MSKDLETKKVDETTPEADPATETNADESTVDDNDLKPQDDSGDSDDSELDNQIDYAAELEKERQEKENYKTGMLNAKDKLKKEKLKSPLGQESPASDDKIRNIIREELGTFKTDTKKDDIQEIASQYSSTEDERELILHHYENTIRQSGFDRLSIEKDMARAKMLANEKTIVRENKQLKDALKAKKSISNDGVGSGTKPKEVVRGRKLNEQEAKLMQRRGKTPADYIINRDGKLIKK